MLFHSYEFLFAFFPLMLLGYGISRRITERNGHKNRIKNLPCLWLLLTSLIFYGLGGVEYLPVLLVSMAVNYELCQWMEKKRETRGEPWKILVMGLVFHLGVLCGFKYLAAGRYMPPGLSFYTFTQIAFMVECYRGNLKRVDALSYSLYVAWFPKMMQGPIMLPAEFFSKLQGIWERNRAMEKSAANQADWERIFRGIYLFVLGLFKKVLIADTFGSAVNHGYAMLPALNSWDGMIVMLSYTLQLYFDFSGYCDMAMGISGLLGIELPLNFNSPYKAANILEFWKRWHMTLTGFFTRYVYIPLGGNRKGRARTYVNVLIVFLLSGIWHGTGVQFLIWGMMHGVLYVGTRAVTESGFFGKFAGRYEKMCGPGRWILHGVSVLLTFLYVNVAWVFFRAPSVKEAVTLLKTLAGFRGGRVDRNLAGCFNLDEFWYVIKVLRLDSWQYGHYICMALILAAALLLVFFGRTAVDFVKAAKPKMIHALIMAVLFVWSVLSLAGVSSFLYVNF
ncbi:MAG: MBOAT family protein [Lachnospiraceae bacterium]|nr:MBOAT family protein [Lachnospiraceae bacterium]